MTDLEMIEELEIFTLSPQSFIDGNYTHFGILRKNTALGY